MMARTRTSKGKARRRMQLLDDLLDYALRSECRFMFCNGPKAPIRSGLTCVRCACINRAIRMGLVVVVGGSLEQFSAHDGRLVR